MTELPKQRRATPTVGPANPLELPLARCRPAHFKLSVDGPLATVTLDRP